MKKDKSRNDRYTRTRKGSVESHCDITRHNGRFVCNVVLDGVHGGPALTRDFATVEEAHQWGCSFGIREA